MIPVMRSSRLSRQPEVSVPTEDSKFIQQHLANERTFLAWVRTVISFLGVGFVTTTVHFDLGRGVNKYADLLVMTIGLLTLLLAFVAAIFAAMSYLGKRQGINATAFRSTGRFVLFVSGSIVVVLTGMASYMAFAY